jgi:hypothetical protein
LGANIQARRNSPGNRPAGVLVSKLPPRLTDPIDIFQDGDYQLTVTRIPKNTFNPDLLNLNPPDDTAFSIQILNPSLTCEQGPDECNLSFAIRVSNLHSPYRGFRVWVS